MSTLYKCTVHVLPTSTMTNCSTQSEVIQRRVKLYKHSVSGYACIHVHSMYMPHDKDLQMCI